MSNFSSFGLSFTKAPQSVCSQLDAAQRQPDPHLLLWTLFTKILFNCRCTKWRTGSIKYQLSHCVSTYLPGVSCPVLSCPVLSCPVPSCPVLSCPVLSCPLTKPDRTGQETGQDKTGQDRGEQRGQ